MRPKKALWTARRRSYQLAVTKSQLAVIADEFVLADTAMHYNSPVE